jgi:hypothetical protein
MNKEKLVITIGLLLLVSLTLIPGVIAQDEDGPEDLEIFDLEADKLLSLANGWIALFLAVLAITAYKRDGRKRLLFVGIAFLLFSLKSFMIGSELFIPEIPYVDPIAIVLEFFVLLCFFYGVLKK